MTKKILVLASAWLLMLPAKAQNTSHTYKESDEIFANPERGFYIPSGTLASKFVALDSLQLKHYRQSPQKLHGANYSVNVSLLYRAYELDAFRQSALSEEFLKAFQNDLNIVRAAGLKIILRFAYTNATHGGDCKDEYKICPPYGDAPRNIVLLHIRQLKPILQKNADVIAVLQQGFIGIWGENYFTDYFGCATDDGAGVINDTSWVHRNIFLRALLNAMPANRMVQVRTPQIKQRYLYGPRATPLSAPMKAGQAFTKQDIARIGFHNDCFLASADDYGTFFDYGNSVSKRDTANINMRRYFEADSRYVAVGGETCDDAYSPQNDCNPYGIAEQEMASMHYSYLNAAYNNQVNNDWDSLGCMGRIQRQLGYRFVLKTMMINESVSRGKIFSVQLDLVNRGYASPFNPRPVQLLLRNKETGKIISFTFNTAIQKWFPGDIKLQQQFQLPATSSTGKYEVLLNLPDEYKSIRNNPLYSIRLANENVWEEGTGLNLLGELRIKN